MTARPAKNVLREITPPVALRAARRVRDAVMRRQTAPEWEYVATSWSHRADGQQNGWNAAGVAEASVSRWAEFVAALEGPGPLGVTHEVHEGAPVATENIAVHNTIVSFAYVLALAARTKDRLSILDWGGGLGYYHEISKAVLPGVEIEYSCKEVPVLCAAGRKLAPSVTFYEDESCFDRSYDLVLASGSLHFSEDWQRVLGRLAAAAAGYLFVARVPLVSRAPSFVFLQRAQAYGYGTEYLGWAFNRDDFLACVPAAEFELVREFLTGERVEAAGAPAPIDFRSFAYSRIDAGGSVAHSR